MTAATPQAEHFLLTVDVDAIQTYVYESSRLPEIRGASQLVKDFDTGMSCAVVKYGGEVCRCVGGSLTAYFASREKAEECSLSIEQKLIEKTMVVTATSVVVPCAEDPRNDDNHQEFNDARQEAAVLLRHKKLSRKHVPFFEAPPYAQRCASCDVRPAFKFITEYDPQRPICEACNIKYENGKGERERGEGPVTLEDLDAGKPIGMIMLDGDGIGQAIRGKSWKELHTFSKNLHEALASALKTALAAENITDKCQGMYAGGDDLLLFVPGANAFSTALRIMDTFEQCFLDISKNEGNDETASSSSCPTLSGGVVISHPHYPVYYLHRLIKALASSAKQGRRHAGSQEGWLDFEILRSASSSSSNLGTLRGMREHIGDKSIKRTYDRPLSRSHMRTLLETAKCLKDHKLKGQIMMIAEAQGQGMLQGSAFAIYQMTRDANLRTALKPLMNASYTTPPGWHSSQPTNGGPAVYATCLADLADLYDFA